MFLSLGLNFLRKNTTKSYSKTMLYVAACMLLGAISQVQAQPAAVATAVRSAAPAVLAGPIWLELTPSQRAILQPLAPTWESLDLAGKRKWLAVAASYPRLGAVEQEKMQSRMAQWAALSPRERAVARLNFEETKKVSPSDRAANWDAYQALSPEDRQKLAAKAPTAPLGAAIAPKKSNADKVTPVPVTRHTPAGNTPQGVVPPAIDRKTLLPQAPKPIRAASEPAAQ